MNEPNRDGLGQPLIYDNAPVEGVIQGLPLDALPPMPPPMLGKRRRRALDFYPTGGGKTGLACAAASLYRRHPVIRGIAEPCVGTGDLIAGRDDVRWTNDIDPQREATHHRDAAQAASWLLFERVPWIVTNPPFSQALDVLVNALMHASDGVAFLLRLSFLEPTEGRTDVLSEQPPTRILVLPRMSFTGDGRTDSVTCAWMIWSKHIVPGVEICQRSERA